MINKKIIKDNTLNKEMAIFKNNDKLLDGIKKGLTKKFKEQIYVVKEIINNLPNKNKYHIYKENLRKNPLNIEVNTIQEAIALIYGINLFKYFDLPINIHEKVKLEIPIQFKYISFLANTETEAQERIKEISKKYDLKNAYIKSYKNENIKYELSIPISSYVFVNCSKKTKEYNIFLTDNEDINNKEYQIKFCFIDLYCMLFNLEKKQAVMEIMDLLDIEVLEGQELKEIYVNNLKALEKVNMYPNLNKLLRVYIYLLREILNLAIEEIYFSSKLENKDYVFFSQRYLAKIVKRSQSTVSPCINGLATLKFFTKAEAEDSNTNNINKNSIYNIPNYTEEFFNNAEKIAKLLVENNTSLSDINYKVLKELFEEEEVNKIIKDKLVKRSSKND